MRSFVQRHESLILRLFLACAGAALMVMGTRALGAGLVSYSNARGQPVPSLFAYWIGVVLVAGTLVPIAVYRWFFSWLPEHLRPRLPAIDENFRDRS